MIRPGKKQGTSLFSIDGLKKCLTRMLIIYLFVEDESCYVYVDYLFERSDLYPQLPIKYVYPCMGWL